MTKDSTNKKRKVTFALPDSEGESGNKEKSKNRSFPNRKTPPRPRFEPPPPDSDIQVRPILKKTDTPVYQAPISTTSFLPLYIINSVINSQFTPTIPDFFEEDSESENNSGDSDTPSNNRFIKNNLNLSHKTNGESESNSLDDNSEENVDVWFLNSKDKAKKKPLQKEKEPKKSFLVPAEGRSLNNSLSKDTKSLSLQGSGSSDIFESADNNQVPKVASDKLKDQKQKGKFKLSINIQENDSETDTKNTFELELGSKPSSDNKDSPEKDSICVLQSLNVSEVIYLDYQCIDNFNLDLSIPKTTIKTSFIELSDALSCSPPAVVESKAVLPLRICQSIYLNNPREETIDIYSIPPRTLARKTSVESFNAVVQSSLVVLCHSPENETQPVNVSEIIYLDHCCEEYLDTNLALLRAVPKTTFAEFNYSVVFSPPVIARNLKHQKKTNVSELGYFDCCCDEYVDINKPLLQTLATKTFLEYSNAVVCLPPLIIQIHTEIEKSPELKRSFKTRRKSSVQFADTTDTEDKENFHQPSTPFDKRTEAQTNSILQPISLQSNTLPLSSTSSQLAKPTTKLSPTTLREFPKQQYSTSTYLNQFSKIPLHSSSNKHISTAVKLPGGLEENRTPSQRVLRPYQRKPRQPLTLIMDSSQDLNCAGEPENLSPHKRDDIKEKDILIWIYNMIDEPARVDYEFFLKDGCILCKLMNRIKPGCIPEENITWEGAKSKQKNITNFLTQAENYGVPKSKLFYSEDLLHLRHIPRVTRCIYALAKIAQEDTALGPNCPRLGDEPSFVQETKKVAVPGHRDTKEVLTQIASSMQKKEEEEGGGGGGEKKLQRMHSLYN